MHVRQIPVVILARRGSKGIPEKNLKEIDGESLVLRAARKAAMSNFTDVYIYSDSEQILSEAYKVKGAKHIVKPVLRPIEISGDTVTSEETISVFLEQVDKNQEIYAVALMQCTTPFIRTEHLDAAFDMFMHQDVDSVLTATVFDRFLGYQLMTADKIFIPTRPYRKMRQQFRPFQWLENGGCYLATRELWISGRRIGRRCGVVEMGWWESMEIDAPEDLDVARILSPLMEARK